MQSNDLSRRYSKKFKSATRSRSQAKDQHGRRLFLESLETRNVLATLWGIDRADLFSIDDYTQIGAGAAAAGLTEYATLKYQIDAAGATANLQPQIKAFTLDQNGIGYFAYHGSLSFTDGQPTLTAPILLKIDTAAVTEAGPNVVSIIGSIPIGSLNVDAIRSLSVDPATGDLFGTLKTSGPDQLIKISTTDASITANIGPMQNAALGAIVDNAEDIEFDESGNLYVSDQTDDHLYQVDPATASIISLIDNNVPGGIVPPAFGNIIVEGIGWDPDLNQLVGIEDEANLFYIQTLQNGNNIPLGSLGELRSPSSIDFETPPTKPQIDIEKFVKRVEPCSGEGLTPGFWKTHSEYGPAPLKGWPEAGYDPDDSYEAIFGVDVLGVSSSFTLLDALSIGGGGVNALLRHSTAALLNSAHPNIEYGYTAAQVIALTKTAISSGNATQIENLKNQFDSLNNQGADLSNDGNCDPGTGLGSDADTPASAIGVKIGDSITFSYVVTNPGTAPVNNVVVSDDGGLGPNFNPTRGPDIVGNNDNVLTPGEQWLYTATGTVSGSDCNVATVTGNNANPPNQPVSDSDPACWSPNPKIDIEKYVKSGGSGLGSDADTPNSAITVNIGDTITFSYVVTNPGALPVNNVDLNDDGGLGPDFNPTRGADIVGNNDNVLTPGEQWLYTATTTVTGEDCNIATVIGQNTSAPNQFVNDTDPACWKIEVRPGIDIEKTTNGPSNANTTSPDFDNEDVANGPGVPILTPGTTVTWTYKVTNTGNVPYAFNEVVVSDDNGTPGNTADDLSTTDGDITFQSVQAGDADNSLEPGEVWLYSATGTVQSLVVPSGDSPVTFNFSGSTALDGPDGNIRTFTAGSIAVKASAFSRTESGGAWSSAFLGSYPGGLGVTDTGETGANDTHTVDNLGGRDNYVLFEFSESVIIDSAFLGYVVNDSDLTVWIGTKADPFNNHLTLSDAVLSSLGFTETNLTVLSTPRSAELNSGNLAGNVVVIAAQVDDITQEDNFKIEKVTVKPTKSGIYENKGTVTVPGDTDSDLSHYKNPAPTTPPPPPEPPVCVTIKTTGGTKTTGTKGNIKTFSFGDISVKASAFSRTNSTGAWLPAYLGAYSGGLGVTDTSESGASNSHTVDNVGGRNNYVLFEFSKPVVVDKALLGYVAGDSDISVWIGTLDNPFDNHQTLSDALLASLGFTEINETTSTTARTADINSGNKAGNVLVIAGSIADVTPDDQFKIANLNVCIPGGTKFYVVNDSTVNKTYGYTSAGTLDATTSLVAANADPRGITTTVNGSPVWVIDADKTVYVYDANGNSLGSWGARKTAAENATVSTSVQGIATDGTDIWIVDDATNEVFYYADGAAWRDNGAPRNATSKFTLATGNINPRDITFGTIESGGVTKRYLWVVDDSSVDKVFRYELKADNSVQAVVSWTINSANSKPRGITLDPTGASQDIWIVDDGTTDKVYRYSNGKTRVTGTSPVAGVWTLASGNNSPQGIADPLQVFLDAEPDATDPVIRFDVNKDGFVSPADVLSIFNKLNSGSLQKIGAEGEETSLLPSYDVNGDGILTSFDALQVINYLNGLADSAASALGAATTESTSSDSASADGVEEDTSDEVDLSYAIDIAFEQEDDLQFDDSSFVISEDDTAEIIDRLIEDDELLSE